MDEGEEKNIRAEGEDVTQQQEVEQEEGETLQNEEAKEVEEVVQDKQTHAEPGQANQGQHDEQQKALMSSSAAPQPQEQSCISYGKNKVLLKTKCLTIFIGPDYLCFLATFIIFALVSFCLIRYIDETVKSQWGKILTKIVCIGHCLSYLLVALSDPGIARPASQENKAKQYRTVFCRRCQFHVPSRSVHCAYCDVCIEGYDHHCPWTSKCIGKNNLYRFYIFLFTTPIFIIYCAFAFGATLQVNDSRRHHLKVNPKS